MGENRTYITRVVRTIARQRTAILLFIGVTFAGVAAPAGIGWYYSESLKSGALVPDRSPDELDLRITAADGNRITLQATSAAEKDGDWTKAGVFGIEWSGGYGQVGTILAIDESSVVRDFTALNGTPAPGEPARLDSFAFPGDPLDGRGLPFTEVAIPTELGPSPAWLVEGGSSTWAIFAHGKGANRREALRMLPAVQGAGLTSLVITYRNDVEAPASDDGFYRYGDVEWKDLESAAQYAIDRGASELLLVGYSMGGGIVMSFLHNSPLAGRVKAVILDSPMLDFSATVDHGARKKGLPGFIGTIGKRIAARRFDIPWGRLNYLGQARELHVPVLLFHGAGDKRVPVTTSDTLAKARPDIVTYVRTPGAGHVRSWNADPKAYETKVREFLARVLE